MKRNTLISFAIGAIILVALAVYGAKSAGFGPFAPAASDSAAIESASGEEPAAQAPVTASETVTEQAAEEAPSMAPGRVDAEHAMKLRTVGNPDAPIRMEEFASLSCSHCATFYNETYPQLKEQYIDTGKVFFVYNDLPTSASALDAAMVARCLPEAHYFNFIKMLFENQSNWAYSENYREILQQNAAMLGMSTDYFNACVGNEEISKGIADRVNEMRAKHDVRSTPTFIINGTQMLVGSQSIEDLQKVFEPLLAEKQN
jgi:protein-disulfide isomerase